MISEVGPHGSTGVHNTHYKYVESGEYSQTCTELCRVVKGEWVLGQTLGMGIGRNFGNGY